MGVGPRRLPRTGRRSPDCGKAACAVHGPMPGISVSSDISSSSGSAASTSGFRAQYVGRRRKTATEPRLNAGESPPGCRDRQLLTDNLEQQGAEQVHPRQLSHPSARVEIRPVNYQLGQHRVSTAQKSLRLLCPGPGGFIVHAAILPRGQVSPHPQDLVTQGPST